MNRIISTQLVVVIVSLFLLFSPASAIEVTAPWAPTLRWDYDRTTSSFHSGVNDNCVDFNWVDGVNGDADTGSPILATQDGKIEDAKWSSSYGWHVWVLGNDGSKNIFAHLFDEPVVKKGELVKVGQVIGFCGCTPGGDYCTGPHLHYGHYVSGVAQLVTVIDGQSVSQNSVAVSKNIAPVTREFNANGGSGPYGTLQNPTGTYAGVHWHYTYDSSNPYRTNNLANNCYVQNWAGSTYNTCGIIYDALGGARRAYTVRNGFYHDDDNQGWNDTGGPTSNLGMPITNEYPYQGGARQDFQTGYLQYQQGHTPTEVWFNSYTAPGWTNATNAKWNNQFSYLMAMAYDRNGRDPAVGHATGNATSSNFSSYNNQGVLITSSYYKQNFTGGSNGDGAIFYHPENVVHNPQATNEAYYLYGDFWAKWNAMGGANSCGVPTRDWYMSYDPMDWATDSMFQVQNFMLADGEQHYMIRKWHASSGQWTVNWHSSYNSDWVTQSPFTITMRPGQTATFSVTYKNKGSSMWLGSGTSSSHPSYIELRACNSDGEVENSWLQPASGWISASRVVTASEASIATNANATFSFTVQVPLLKAPGVYRQYFRPYQTTGGLIEEWDGYYVELTILDRFIPLAGDFNGGGKADVCLYEPVFGQWFVATSTGSAFTASGSAWLGSWGANATAYQPLVGDFNGDGKTDVALYQMATGGWFVATSNGSSFTASGSAWLANWGANATAYRALAGDFTGDGKTDVGLYEPATGGWFVAVSNGSAFTPSGSAWMGPWGANATAYRPIVGWFNSGGACDVGLYEPANGGWYVATSNGSSNFTPSPSGWLGSWGASTTAYQNLTADFTGGGLYDVCLYEMASGGWFVATSNGSSFTASGSAWLANWGANATGYRAVAGDFTGDGKADVCLYEPGTGGWYVATSNGSSFTASPSGWLGNWGDSYAARFPGPEMNSSPSKLAFRLWAGPNPTASATTIHFTLPVDDRVSISIYDVSGREVAKMPEQAFTPGQHFFAWTGKNRHGQRVANGVYFVRFNSHQRTTTTKIVIVK